MNNMKGSTPTILNFSKSPHMREVLDEVLSSLVRAIQMHLARFFRA